MRALSEFLVENVLCLVAAGVGATALKTDMS